MLKQLVTQFTTAPMVGVDLGSTTLKVVELARSNGGFILRRCTVAPLEGADAAKSLKQVCAKTGLTTAQAALGLASPEVVVRPFQFPAMPKKELESAIQLEAEQAILNGHSLGGMAIDWHVLSSSGTSDALRGLLAVVPKEVLSERLQAARSAGLRPSVIDVEGLALWNA